MSVKEIIEHLEKASVKEIIEHLEKAQPKYERWSKQGVLSRPHLGEMLTGPEVQSIRFAIQWAIEEGKHNGEPV